MDGETAYNVETASNRRLGPAIEPGNQEVS